MGLTQGMAEWVRVGKTGWVGKIRWVVGIGWADVWMDTVKYELYV